MICFYASECCFTKAASYKHDAQSAWHIEKGSKKNEFLKLTRENGITVKRKKQYDEITNVRRETKNIYFNRRKVGKKEP